MSPARNRCTFLRSTSSASLGLTKSIMSFYSTQIAKSNLFQEDFVNFWRTVAIWARQIGEPDSSGTELDYGEPSFTRAELRGLTDFSQVDHLGLRYVRVIHFGQSTCHAISGRGISQLGFICGPLSKNPSILARKGAPAHTISDPK